MKKLNNNVSKAISSLEWAISRNDFTPQTEDEFTIIDFQTHCNLSARTALTKLTKMVKDKELTCRKLSINGKSTNLYRKC